MLSTDEGYTVVRICLGGQNFRTCIINVRHVSEVKLHSLEKLSITMSNNQTYDVFIDDNYYLKDYMERIKAFDKKYPKE
jgi:hexokinase